MPRVEMARKTKQTSHNRRQRKTKRNIRTRKHHRKQYITQKRIQHGGVSDDLPTTSTLNGTPYVANDDIYETSVSVQGFGQMTPKEYKIRAEKGDDLVVDN